MNQHKSRKALLAGASGLIGSELLNLLLNDTHYSSVTALVRKPLGFTHPKLTQKVVDFENLQSAGVAEADDAFCTLGTTIKKAGSRPAFIKVDLEYVREFALLSQAAGVRNFLVVSSMGANARSSVFYNRTKGMMENSVQAISFNRIVIFRPSLLMGKRKEYRFGESVAAGIMKFMGILFTGPLLKYKGIAAKTVATAMIVAAKEDKAGVEILESDRIQQLGKC